MRYPAWRNQRYRFVVFCLLVSWALLAWTGATASAQAGQGRSPTNGAKVHALASQGDYIWAGTDGGAIRWNRADASYVRYTTTDGLADNEVQAVAIDPAGPVWFGTRTGVSRFDGQGWTTYTTAEGLARNEISALAIDGHGHVWAGTTGTGLSEFDGQVWKTHLLADPHFSDSVALYIDPANRVWLGTSFGAYLYDGQAILTEPIVLEGNPDNGAWAPVPSLGSQAVNTITPDAEGGIWFGLFDRMSRFDGQNWESLDFPWVNHNGFTGIAALAIDGTGRVWASGWNSDFGAFDGRNWRAYGRQEGLPGYNVEALLVDEQGYLWAGTDHGLARFDGQGWATYHTRDRVPNDVVKTMSTYVNATCVYDLAIAGNDIWTATCGGVVWWDRMTGKHRLYTAADGLPRNNTMEITVDPAGRVWTVSRRGELSGFDGHTWSSYTETTALTNAAWRALKTTKSQDDIWFKGLEESNSEPDPGNYPAASLDYPVLVEAFDPAGQLWVGTENGLFIFDGQDWQRVETKPRPTPVPDDDEGGKEYDFIYAIAFDEAGQVWVGSGDDLRIYDGRAWRSYTTTDGLPGDWVEDIVIDRAGNKWIATYNGGVGKFDGQRWTGYSTADGLLDNRVTALAFDDDGQLWAATYGGLNRFDGQRWQPYVIDNGLGNLEADSALAFDPAGRLWLGYSSQVVKVLDGQTVTTYTSEDGLPASGVNSLLFDERGQTWAGTGKGLSRFDGQTWRTYTTADGLPSDEVNALASDGHGSLWVGTGKGLSRFDGQAWTTYPLSDDVYSNNVNALALDGTGRLWVGTSKGLRVFDGQAWTLYTSADILVKDEIRAIAVDQAGHIWAGTAYDGVSRFDGQRWSIYDRSNGLSDDSVRAIVVDRANRVWLATFGGGVSVYDGQEWTVYNTVDGLADDFVETLAVDRQGRVWAGTGDGITIFEPQPR